VIIDLVIAGDKTPKSNAPIKDQMIR